MHVVMAFQAYNLFPHMTALQNITLPLEKVHGRTRNEASQSAKKDYMIGLAAGLRDAVCRAGKGKGDRVRAQQQDR